ncbi:Tn7 transposase TnsA N-terminal domain-containing protein [Amycolatopsis sp. NPDC098790]|uniref:Tn7 transposase TnsA N-terminal domain-containing protein n=1 Tax=Amycolatopsis sp. NPDC098790 TaxID=3363939 RepID=UPI003816A4B9
MLSGVRQDYYPDLLVDLRDGRRLLVEVKAGIDDFALAENVAKFAAARDYCQELGWGFVAIPDRLTSPADLVRREVDSLPNRHYETTLQRGRPIGREWNRC